MSEPPIALPVDPAAVAATIACWSERHQALFLLRLSAQIQAEDSARCRIPGVARASPIAVLAEEIVATEIAFPAESFSFLEDLADAVSRIRQETGFRA